MLWGHVFIEIDRSKYAEQFRQIRDEFRRDVLDGLQRSMSS